MRLARATHPRSLGSPNVGAAGDDRLSGNLGMFEWGGIAVDPVRQIAIANPIAIPFVSKLDNPPAANASHPPGGEMGVQPM